MSNDGVPVDYSSSTKEDLLTLLEQKDSAVKKKNIYEQILNF